MTVHPPYALAASFDAALGDPADPGRAFSFRRCAELDRAEEFPAEICRELDALGVPRHYVPAEHGGAARDYEDLFQLVRMLARRDVGVVVAHTKTYLGAVSAWVGAEPEQARRLAERITGGAVVSWGLTERDHGSDLVAGEVRAVPAGDGHRISGEKWLINNATRGDLVCVLARTDPAGGARGFSLLLVDKHELPEGTYRPLPAVRTHGIRGTDISGIAFTEAPVGPDALIGEPGAGLEIVLKGLQLTRTLCAALSLGAADHALRLAMDFAFEHRMYGRTLFDLPQCNRTLTEAYADLLAAEAVGLVASRAVHALPEELSVLSAAVKSLVPAQVDRLIRELGQVLGARAFLTEAYAGGRFQKVERDHRIVAIFDGSTPVNLHALISQFPSLARGHRNGTVDAAGVADATVLARPLPGFRRGRLTLVSRGGCSLVQGMPAAVRELRDLAARGRLPGRVADQADRLLERVEELHKELEAHRPAARDVPAEAFDLARRYTLCLAAACCQRLWLGNREDASGALWDDALWLEAAQARLLALLSPGEDDGTDTVHDRLAEPLTEQYRTGALFSPLPCPPVKEAR